MALELPRAIVDTQCPARGDVVHARKHVYGYEFARRDTKEAFYLVLVDDWHSDLAARPVRLSARAGH